MKFTLSGLESFMNGQNDSLFEFIGIPANFPENASPELAKAVIMERYGEMETLYSDPYRLKFATEVFFRKHKLTFDKWFSAINLEYEPLYNFDRYEEWTDETAGQRAGSTRDAMSGNNSRVNSGSDQISSAEDSNILNSESATHSGSNDATDIMHINESTADNVKSDKISTDSKSNTNNTANNNNVAAYNSTTLPTADAQSAYANTNETDAGTESTETQGINSRSGLNSTEHSGGDSATDNKSGSASENKTANSTNNRTDSEIENTSQNNESSSTEADSRNATHRGHLYGNIGVTTSSALLMEYQDASSWNFYTHVADLYAEELLLMVY